MAGDRLAEAEIAAAEKEDQQALGAASVACPLKQREEKYRIEVHVVGEDDQPLGDIAVVLRRLSGEELKGVTDDAGNWAFEGLDKGEYEVSLVDLDRDAWLELKQEALPDAAAKSKVLANWQLPSAVMPVEERTHTIVQGECVSKIAEQYGFFPETIWHYPTNAELRDRRHDNLYILFPGDTVAIPPKRLANLTVVAGSQITLRRKGVPERLRIRFLRYNERPRVDVPYLLNVKNPQGTPVASIKGKTDGGGFLDQCVPPSAIFAEVILKPESDLEVHRFDLGYLDPIDTVSGLQARLNNLMYECGSEEGVLSEQTRMALRAFQVDKKLSETGDIDKEAQIALQSVALS